MPTRTSPEQLDRERQALLDAAESLFYERGIQAVGMDAVRAASGISLKRIYGLFPTKEDLVVAVLKRRDLRWRSSVVEYVRRYDQPRERVLALFDWLERWFAEPEFRGCAWINVYGELGSASPAILAEVRSHKDAFHRQIATWANDVGDGLAVPLCLLAEGAIVMASIQGGVAVARDARTAARALMD
ncbi:putative TetR family transcriptional regulator [Gordonia effusa NBRC 100432]|uniref:Putative TetR family transcriptional regulator n=1 Tax=Gordonia effusa NBRC 100432 TaxID=1077974 RepID=H0R1T0_9ACTN|nr:TetR/AcrR family transcriptional regulator [Gordonia effusa]GAB19031.1 putative TetR family transcriptional regulator [Gordonia effusa NBRC 100432]